MGKVSDVAAFKISHLNVYGRSLLFMNHMRMQQPTPAHLHNRLEIAFILGGTGHHNTIRGVARCRRGDVFVIPRGAWHAFSHCRRLEVINCLLSPLLFENELQWLGRETPFSRAWGCDGNGAHAEVSAFRIRAASLPELALRLQALKSSHEGHARRSEWIGRLLLVLDMLGNSAVSQSTDAPAKDGLHPSVRAAMELFRREPAREWTLPVLGKRLGINPCYLVRVFRRQTGLPPKKYLAKLRAEQAATLLLGTSRSIAEIGNRVGWPEPIHFSRSFKHHFGVNATAYRRQMSEIHADYAPVAGGGDTG